LQQRIRNQLTVSIADGLRNDWLAICIFRSNLVERDGDPFSDSLVDGIETRGVPPTVVLFSLAARLKQHKARHN
jgi:hypothetical protein